MGGDYIPEDNLLSRVTPQRTRRLLEDARLAHFNTVRIWGGGYYPDDFFYDICDELGLYVIDEADLNARGQKIVNALTADIEPDVALSPDCFKPTAKIRRIEKD